MEMIRKLLLHGCPFSSFTSVVACCCGSRGRPPFSKATPACSAGVSRRHRVPNLWSPPAGRRRACRIPLSVSAGACLPTQFPLHGANACVMMCSNRVERVLADAVSVANGLARPRVANSFTMPRSFAMPRATDNCGRRPGGSISRTATRTWPW